MNYRLRFIRHVLVCGVIFSAALLNGAEWRRLVRGPVTVNCRAVDLANGERVIQLVEETLPPIVSSLGISSVKPVTIVIASTEREFFRLTGGQIPEWGIAAADPERGMMYLQSPRFARSEIDLRKVVVHELSHLVLGMAVGRSGTDRWFDEGFALYQSGELSLGGKMRMARSLLTGHHIPLYEIDDVLTFQKDRANLAYQESYAAVLFLTEQFGTDILAEIVSELGRGKAMDEVLKTATGYDFYDFEDRWLRFMKAKYRWAALLDYPMIFSVIIVVFFTAATIATRLRIRKKRQMWEDVEFEEEN